MKSVIFFLILLLAFSLQMNGQNVTKYSDNEPIFRILYGGYTSDELVCDSVLLGGIADKEMTILDTRSNEVIQIDSFVAIVYGKRGEAEEYYVKGNKFPDELQRILTNYVYYKIICVGPIFYFIDGKYLIHYTGACLSMCRNWLSKEKQDRK